MSYRRLGLPISALAAAVIASTFVIPPVAGASSASSGVTSSITPAGTVSFVAQSQGMGSGGSELPFSPTTNSDAAGAPSSDGVNRSKSEKHSLPESSSAPVSSGQGVSSDGPLKVLASFNGLNHRDQRTANGGNQFSLEPPDQGLCAGNGAVMEIINDVVHIYSPTGGTLQATRDLNTFFGYPAQNNRTTHVVGPFVTDPSCYYDIATNRWFADVLTLDVFSDGEFTGRNHLDLAVSQTGDPTGVWTIYTLNVTDDSGAQNHGCTGIAPYGQPTTPLHPNACLGDYPHLGADAGGIYITTNEYSFFGVTFHGAQIYALSKAALAASGTVIVTQFDTNGLDNGNSGFTVWPATAPAGLNSTAHGGTEYFLSSNAGDEAHNGGSGAIGPRQSNQLLVWSLTNTSTLAGTPALNLSHKTLRVGTYTVPPPSVQKVGSTPLVDCLNDINCATNFLLGGPDPLAPEHEYALDSNDSRMQQVVFADGKLWGALDTGIKGRTAGIEWFVVNPNGEEGPSIANQGYLSVKGQNVTYPAISVTPSGKGVMAFTLVGPSYFPSAAFASINEDGVGPVQVAALGLGPADGFSGTKIFNAPNPPRPRWGDYGAAVVDGDNIWIASEYIAQTCTLSEFMATRASCGGTRTALGNWGTRITEVNPNPTDN